MTDITFLLDRSGSMMDIWSDVEGNMNNFLNDQKKIPGQVNFTLVVFDNYSGKTQLETVVENVDIKSFTLDLSKHLPRGGTPLRDAVGGTINNRGSYFASLSESDRPEKVLFAILTDGLENASNEFTPEKIKQMTTLQSEKYNWEFIYLGANQDAFAVGHQLGVPTGNIMNFASTGSGVASASVSLSSSTKNYRSANYQKGNFFNGQDKED